MSAQSFKAAVVGGGLLGISIAYFLSAHARRPDSVVLLEQESNVAMHTSSRNTGKVHAPFLYDPSTKKTLAKAAALGYEMWLEYCGQKKNLKFVQDGVLEVATDERGIERLRKYMEWGKQNGLLENELQLLDANDVNKIEPSVRCAAAIYCSKDGSVDYGALAFSLLADCQIFGCKVLLGNRVTKIVQNSGKHTDSQFSIATSTGVQISADYIINAAGGNAVDVAHGMGVADQYTDLHFRGEYWQAPGKYKNLTKLSIYSVPKHPEYPFLDPHWIVRADGRREVGPNAVPVFGPYAYGWSRNLADMIPKILESSRTGARKVVLNRQFLSLASEELKSSLSKTAMINRVREFLPQVRPADFQMRGTSGIRSSVIDSRGRFVPDTMILDRENSLHILNYNSPGATGALPMAARIVATILEKEILEKNDQLRSLWGAQEIAEKMK